MREIGVTLTLAMTRHVRRLLVESVKVMISKFYLHFATFICYVSFKLSPPTLRYCKLNGIVKHTLFINVIVVAILVLNKYSSISSVIFWFVFL